MQIILKKERCQLCKKKMLVAIDSDEEAKRIIDSISQGGKGRLRYRCTNCNQEYLYEPRLGLRLV